MTKRRENTDSDPDSCPRGVHEWLAVFFRSGALAYWKCERCGKADRDVGSHDGPLETFWGAPMEPPRLVVTGREPPPSARRWQTRRGTILVEGDPSSTHFEGRAIPDLPATHAYVETNAEGAVLERYDPDRERHSPFGDRYTLIRYEVVGDALVRFSSYCFEESTYDVPFAHEPKRKVVLAGLKSA